VRAPSTNEPVAEAGKTRVRGRLFRKYVGLFMAVVCVALLTNGLPEIWFSYQEHKASLVRIQREQAEAAAAKISQSQLDSTGREQLRVSRLAMDVVAGQSFPSPSKRRRGQHEQTNFGGRGPGGQSADRARFADGQ